MSCSDQEHGYRHSFLHFLGVALCHVVEHDNIHVVMFA